VPAWLKLANVEVGSSETVSIWPNALVSLILHFSAWSRMMSLIRVAQRDDHAARSTPQSLGNRIEQTCEISQVKVHYPFTEIWDIAYRVPKG
jgi:hypothetical protein